jgi:hypothetical protein
MSLINEKKNIFSNISALNVLNDGFPKFGKINSFNSISNSTNSSEFLIELLVSLVGYDGIKTFITNTLTYELDKVDLLVKSAIKKELKSIVSCSINPSIPDWFKSTGEGISMNVKDVDFFDIMMIDPETSEGSLIYTDVISRKNSTDFNTYLNYTIQDIDVTSSWGDNIINRDIITTKFSTETNSSKTNVLNFKSSVGYDNLTLPKLNNDFVDSMSLFGNPNSLNSPMVINNLLEDLFGSVTKTTNKSKKQIENELKLKELIDCMINNETSDVSDNFFTFDNPTLSKIDNRVSDIKRGIRKLVTCGNLEVSIELDEVINAQNLILSSETKSDEAKNVSKVLDDLANSQADFTSNSFDIPTIKINFFIEIINKLINILISMIMSPKFITIIAINNKIIYGSDPNYDNGVDFVKKNKNLINNIIKSVRDEILRKLLAEVIRELSIKLAKKKVGDNIEKVKNYQSIILSYIPGSSQELISKIRRI